MDTFKKYVAAFFLSLMVWTMVNPLFFRASAQDLGNIIEGVISAALPGGEATQLVRLVEEVSSLSEKVADIGQEEKDKNRKEREEALRFLSFLQTSYYSIQSLRIIEHYSRDVSQFVSDLATGRYSNMKSAMFSAERAVRSAGELLLCFNDLKRMLLNGGRIGAEGQHSVIQSTYERISSAYGQFLGERRSLLSENNNLKMEEFQRLWDGYRQSGYRYARPLNHFLQQNPEFTKLLSVSL